MTDQKNGAKAAVTNIVLNSTVQEIDAILKARIVGNPETQMGILMIAQAQVFRRILAKHQATGRGPRMKLLRFAVQDFESKLRQFGVERECQPEGVTKSAYPSAKVPM